ncbi:MAG TPA: HAMP domain-containing sensor histidine kinase [Roseiflexaceae bacterium]|nr:HAMP domain-containing sensor histidine kinase [Roseiflexaceae bacterium]
MRRVRTLRVRFAIWTAGLLCAALLLFGLFVYTNMARSLTTAVDERLQFAGLQMVAEVEVSDGELVFTENPIEEPHYAQLREQGFSLRVMNLSGRTLEENGPFRAWPPPGILAAAPPQPGSFTTVTDPGSQEEVRVYTAPIVTAGQVAGMLQVAIDLSSVRGTLDLLLITLLLGGPLIVLAAGGGGYLLAARALAPIDAITRTARSISAGDLSARLNLPETNDEIGRLAATFDSMLMRLDDAFRRERQFTADASHELRTPLSAIQTIISSTLERRRTAAEYEQALQDLSHEAASMRALTEGLLHLARHDASRRPLRHEPVDLALLLKDVVDSLRPAAEAKGLELIEHVPDTGLTVLGDSDGLIRLFVNLVDNAIKYTEQGSVTLSAAQQGDKGLLVTINDTGVGISAEQLPHIFDRFYRVDTARSKEGIGLGLAIARSIARTHGGDITVTSAIGKGTTFTVRLPLLRS